MSLDALKQLLESLDHVFQLSNIPVLLTRADGSILGVYGSAREWFHSEELPGSIYELFVESEIENVRSTVDRLTYGVEHEAGGELKTWPIRTAQGQVRDIAWAVELRVFRGIRHSILVWIGTDLTELNRLANDIRETNTKFKTLMELSPLGIIHYDRNGVITDVNPRAIEILGSRKELLVGLNIQKLPNHRVVDALKRSLSGDAVTVEGVYISVTGQKKTPGRATFIPEKNVMGEVVGGLVLIEDWTRQRLIEEAYAESERRFHALTDILGAAVFIVRDTFLYVNPEMEQITGLSAETLKQISLNDLIYPEDKEKVQIDWTTDTPVQYEFRMIGKGGSPRWVNLNLTPLVYRGGPAMLGVVFDVTSLKELLHNLELRVESEEFLLESARLFMDAEPDSFSSNVERALQKLEQRFSLKRMLLVIPDEQGSRILHTYFLEGGQLTQDSVYELSSHSEYINLLETIYRKQVFVRAGEIEDDDWNMISMSRPFDKNGTWIFPLCFNNKIYGCLLLELSHENQDMMKQISRTVVVFAEILASTLAHYYSEQQRYRLASILEATPDLVAIADRQGHTLYLNEAGRRLLGLPASIRLYDLNLTSMRPDWSRDMVLRTAIPEALRHGFWEGETVFTSVDGREIPVSQVILAHRDAKGVVQYLSTIARDISERKEQEKKMIMLANHDVLTGLFNRRRFEEELERELTQVRRFGGQGVLMILDIDDFKYVNDSLGPRAGDDILRQIASLIRVHLRDTDTVARIGGDEFAVFMPHTPLEVALQFARDIVARVRHNVFRVRDQHIHITISAGLVPYPEWGDQPDVLFPRADIALFQAKSRGKSQICVYDESIESSAAVHQRLQWRTRIQKALREGDFLFELQPIANVKTSVIEAYELLLRLKRDEHNYHLPGEFLSIAEHFGIMYEIDQWVVRHAFEILRSIQDRYPDISLHINISSHALMNLQFIDMVRREVTSLGIDASKLVFELTETATISNMSQASALIEELKSAGFRFAIDDFGAGFSSFNYLRNLFVDFIKIDGSYILGMVNDIIDRELVKTINELSHRLNKKTIAEFVGDQPTFELLRELGIDYAQGSFISMPGDIETILKDYAPGLTLFNSASSTSMSKDAPIKSREG